MKIKNKLTGLLWLLSYMTVIAIIFGLFPLLNQPAIASGYSTLVLTPTETKTFYSALANGYGLWVNECHDDLAYSTTAGVGFEVGASSSTSNYWRILSGMMEFNLATIPAGAEIISVTMNMTCISKVEISDPIQSPPYFSIYDTYDHDYDGQIESHDIDTFNDKMIKKRLSAPRHWNELNEGSVITMSFPDPNTTLNLDWGTYTYYHLVTENHALDWDPGLGGLWAAGDTRRAGFDNIKLIITYLGEIPEVEFDCYENAAIDTTILGNEVADNITLLTLSCMYGHEDIKVLVSGNSGASLKLKLLDANNKIITSHDDSVRINDAYYWTIDSLGSSYCGFVRVKEENYNLYSPWMRIEPSYSTSQSSLKTYAKSTEYPQYSNSFSYYMVKRGELMIIHYKTNLDMSTESGISVFQINLNGISTFPVYSNNFTFIGENYFKGTLSNRNKGMHWRFMVFTPKAISGTNLYGNLVQNLNIDFSSSKKGFLQSMIYLSGSEFTETHSAHWYLEDIKEGIDISLSTSGVLVNDEISVFVTIGDGCQADKYLSACIVEILEITNTVAGSVKIGKNIFNLSGIEIAGTYTVRVSLYSSSHTYKYVRDLTLTIAETTAEITEHEIESETDILGKLNAWLKSQGLDNTMGHWMIIMAGMAVAFWAAYKSNWLRWVLPLMVFGLGIIIGWVDLWVVILLAVVFGVFIFSMVRKKIAGGGTGTGSGEG